MGKVMQHRPHVAPRFFVNTRGELCDRTLPGTRNRTGFSIEANRATRTEMQILANMLNEPEHMAEWDEGADPTRAWAIRISDQELHERMLVADPGYLSINRENGGMRLYA